MAESNESLKLLDIPDFFTLPRAVVKFRTSDEGRAELAAVRRQFFASRKQKFVDQSNSFGSHRKCPTAADLQKYKDSVRQPAKLEEKKTDTPSIQEKEALFTSGLKKRELMERPDFFIKIELDSLKSPFIYPQKVNRSPASFFYHTHPSTSPTPRYTLEDKRGSIAELHKKLKNGESVNPSKENSHVRVKRSATVAGNFVTTVSPTKRLDLNLSAQIGGQQFKKTIDISEKRTVRFKKAVIDSDNNIHSISTPLSITNLNIKQQCQVPNSKYRLTEMELVNQTPVERTRSLFVRELRSGREQPQPLSTQDPKVTRTMKERYHFINPEWTSEGVGWKRYNDDSNPLTFRYSWI